LGEIAIIADVIPKRHVAITLDDILAEVHAHELTG
jgi:hypothetical protein